MSEKPSGVVEVTVSEKATGENESGESADEAIANCRVEALAKQSGCARGGGEANGSVGGKANGSVGVVKQSGGGRASGCA